MRHRYSSLSRIVLAMLPALCAGGCAAAAGGPPTLRIRITNTVAATVRDERGRVLGTTPLDTRFRDGQRLVISAPGYDSVVVSAGRRIRRVPIAPLFGIPWEHDPPTLHVPLTRSDSLSDAVAALVLSAFADAAEEAGCEPLLVGAWRDAALALAAPGDPPPPDGTRRIAEEEVRRVAPEVRSLCARRTPRLERLRGIREGLERGGPPVAAEAALFAPVYFGEGSWEIVEDSVRERLWALGRALARQGMPATLRVEGFTDASGPELLNRELGYQRALAVIGELRRGGLPPGCCVAASHGADPAFLVAPGARGAAPEARLNRRVTFSLDYREP